MKWYEIPLTDQWYAALELLNQGRSDDYVKALKRMYILCVEREKQTSVDSEMTSVLAHYQGIDVLLHMEQSKLRVMTDEDLVLLYTRDAPLQSGHLSHPARAQEKGYCGD